MGIGGEKELAEARGLTILSGRAGENSYGGGERIRTSEGLLPTRFPGERLKPLGHASARAFYTHYVALKQADLSRYAGFACKGLDAKRALR